MFSLYFFCYLNRTLPCCFYMAITFVKFVYVNFGNATYMMQLTFHYFSCFFLCFCHDLKLNALQHCIHDKRGETLIGMFGLLQPRLRVCFAVIFRSIPTTLQKAPRRVFHVIA